METGSILQLILVLTGIFLFGVTLHSLARRRMTESFCLAWGLIAVILIIAGIFLRPNGLDRYLSPLGLTLVVIICFCLVYLAYFTSVKLSDLTRETRELTMQVGLLNQENERVMKILEKITDTNQRYL